MDESVLNESTGEDHNDPESGKQAYVKKLQAKKTADIREAFIKTAEDGDEQIFCTFMEKNACKADPFDIGELVEMLDQKHLDKLWAGLKDMCMSTLLSFDEPEDAQVMDEAGKTRLATLQGILTVALATLSKERIKLPEDLTETAFFLNGVLSTLPEPYKKVKHGISKLGETFWINNLDGKEHMISQTIIFLLEECLEPKPPAQLLKRLWLLRDGLLNFDLANDSSTHLRDLLLQTVIHVPVIKNEDGRKFLVFLFGLNLNFIDTLHKAIKQQIPVCPKSILEWYAEIYFKSWKAANGSFKEKLEMHCIQDLMHHAVNASRSSHKSMSSTLRKFLTYFHNQKRQRGVDDMLFRLYEPFLWRSVKVANGNVRANSVALLIDAFPLHEEGATNEETDNLIQKQLDIFRDLLYDPCPIVRATTIQGVCQICKVYWELIPPNVIVGYMQNLIDDLAWDGSSADVRVVVLRGLTHLVGQHLCHPMLNTLLPRLQNLIHDNSEKVRVAMVDLLLKVKGMRLIKVWHIVPMEHILARLEIDTAPVVRRIVSLIHSSFMPGDKSPEVLLSRCVALLQANPAAARKFYRYVPSRMSVNNIGKFMLLMCNYILNCIIREEPELRDENDSQMIEEPDEDSTEITVHNVEIMAGFTETIAILWTGIKHMLEAPGAATIKQALEKKFSMALPRLFKVFQDPRICSSLVFLAGHLPPNNIPMFSKSCLSKLRNMDPNVNQDDYGPMLESLCNWHKVDDVLEIVSEWLGTGLNVVLEEQKGAKERKKVCFQDPVAPKPVLGLQFISYLLCNPICREVVMENSKPRLKEIGTQLKAVMTCVEKRFQSNGPLGQHCTDEFLVEALEMYCKLEVLLHDQENNARDSIAVFEELVAWADVELLSALRNPASQAGNKRRISDADADTLKTLAENLVSVILNITSNMFLVGVSDQEFSSHMADFTMLVLNSDSLPTLIPHCVRLLYQMTEFTYSNITTEKDEGIGTHTDVVPGLLNQVVQALAKVIKNNPEQIPQVVQNVKAPLCESVKSYYGHPNCMNLVTNDVMATIMVAVVTEITSTVTEEGEVLSYQRAADLPPLSSLLMEAIVRQNKLCGLFLEELEQCTKAGALHVHGVAGHTAVLHIINIIHKGKPTSAGLKDCLMATQLKFEELEEPDREEDSVQNELYKSTNTLLHNCMASLGVAM